MLRFLYPQMKDKTHQLPLFKKLLSMRISNKIPIFSFYYRSQVEMLYLKIKVVFSLNFFFLLSVLLKGRMETCSHLYIFGLLFGLPVVES